MRAMYKRFFLITRQDLFKYHIKNEKYQDENKLIIKKEKKRLKQPKKKKAKEIQKQKAQAQLLELRGKAF
ncbi:unnamed protein product [Paramecium sonneborni]|uniref:Uncharacterized protein n=1 Tax=Paramecium sonneborni TaxID=65129 RepID=A0A8S1K156_9CILI|nr:unnamed protein product [Paramecium sonneborni]